MADPIVHITNGIPDSGTGNITTLGQTLTDGANVTLGATTDLAVAAGATGTISAKLRSISRDLVGGIVLQPGANVIGAVTQSGGPWTVSGTIAATQSGAWNITNITGTVSLPTGAATSANQPTNAAIASTTAGQTGHIAMGAATTAAPSYTTGQTNPLSLTTTGLLRVDGSGVTQPVSGSISVAGTAAVTQSGTWTVQPGNTPNTTPWLMTIQQGGNAATVSAAGALKVDNSAVTQPISAASLPLPAGASTAALQPTNAAQASTTAGQTGTLAQGAVSTGAPTYTTGTTNPMSLTTAGAMRVDASATTQPVSGTITANQGGTWTSRIVGNAGAVLDFAGQNATAPANSILVGAEFNTTPTTLTSGNASPLQLDSAGNLLVNIKAGAGSGGTASTFGSAFPSTGTAIGVKDSAGVNMTFLQVNASNALKVDGSAVTQPVSGTFWQATQPVSGTVAATQSGTWNITNISGTVSLPTGAATSANQPSNAAVGSTTSGQTGNLSFGATTTTAPTYTTAQSNPLSLTTAGALRVDGSGATQPVSGTVAISGTVAATQSGTWNITNISGTVSLPTGAATSANQPSNAALGSATTGQTGNLGLGAVTSGAPAYTTATTNALSLTTAGALRVDASATTQPVSGTVTASQGGTWTTRIVGNAGAFLDFAGQNAAAPANSLLIGAEFNTTPTTLTSGNASPLQMDSAGNLLVNIKAGAAAGGTSSSFGAAFPASGTAAGAEYLSTPPTLTNGQMVALQTNVSGALKVDGSAVTQPVSGTVTVTQGTAANLNATVTGTVAATQSGTWNITNVSGTVSLPTGAATSANQPTAAAIASTTSGQTGTLAMGAVTSSNPTYGTTTTNALSLDLSGCLRVALVSASTNVVVTQATAANLNATVTGTVAATQSGNWTSRIVGNAGAVLDFAGQNAAAPANSILIGGEFNTAPTTITSGNASPLQLDNAGNLKVNIQAGAGSGGTASSVGGALPGQGTLAMGSVTTAAPTYTTATANSLSLNTAGGLRVDGSGVTQPVSGTFWQTTQPVSGTVAATQSGNWTSRIVGNAGAIMDFNGQNAAAPANSLLIGAEFNTTPTTLTSGNASPLQLDSAGNLLVNIKAGAGSGGTASSFGAAIPATGTAAGFSDGTNMQLARVFDGDSGAGTQYSLGVLLKTPASGGAVDIGVSGQPIRVDPTGTTTQPVSGTFWQATQPVSGTVTVTQGTAANLNATVTGTVAATQSGTWNITNVSGTVSLPTGAATSANQPTAATLGSTTSGQTGNLSLGAVTTAAPTYTTAQTNALSLTTAGALRVDGSGVTQPVSLTSTTITGTVAATQSGTWTVQPGNTANTTAWLVTGTGGTFPVTGTVTANIGTIAGIATAANQPSNAAQGSTTSGQTGNLALAAVVSGVSAYTTAQSQPLNMDLAGNLKVNTIDPGLYNAGTAWNSATGLNTTVALINTVAISYETIIGQITQTTTITGGQITFEESFDNGATFVTIPPQRLVDPITYLPLANPYICVASTNRQFHIIPSGSGQIRARLSTVIAGSGTVTVSWTDGPISAVDLTNSICGGDTPSGSADSGWPVKMGAVARTANPTAVTTGQRVNLMADKLGKLVAVGALRDLKGVQKTSITTATETTVVTAGAAGVFNDVYAIVVTNKSATAVFVDFKDATAGTTRMTLAAPAGDTRGFTVPVDSAMVQAAAAANWTATVSSAVTSIEITMLYVSNL